MKSSRGFTLLEIIVVMAIIGLIFASTTAMMKGFDDERPLRRPFDDTRALAKKAWMRAMAEQSATQIRLMPDRLVLEPRGAARQEDQLTMDAVDKSNNRGRGLETVKLEPGVTLEFRRYGSTQWTRPQENDFWVFEESGICEPLSIRFVNAYGNLWGTFDPLTAGLVESELEVTAP